MSNKDTTEYEDEDFGAPAEDTGEEASGFGNADDSDTFGIIREAIAAKLAELLPEGTDADAIADELLADPSVSDALGLPGGEAATEDDGMGEELPEEEAPEEAPAEPAEEAPAGEAAPMPFVPKRGESNAIRAMRQQFAAQ